MADKPDLKVVPLYDEAMAQDLVGSLRRSATSIEAETADDDRAIGMMAVLVRESGEIETYGWGQVIDRFQGVGFLHAGALKLIE